MKYKYLLPLVFFLLPIAASAHTLLHLTISPNSGTATTIHITSDSSMFYQFNGAFTPDGKLWDYVTGDGSGHITQECASPPVNGQFDLTQVYTNLATCSPSGTGAYGVYKFVTFYQDASNGIDTTYDALSGGALSPGGTFSNDNTHDPGHLLCRSGYNYSTGLGNCTDSSVFGGVTNFNNAYFPPYSGTTPSALAGYEAAFEADLAANLSAGTQYGVYSYTFVAPTPPPPSNGVQAMIDNANAGFLAATDPTIQTFTSGMGDFFLKPWLGSGLALLFELRYWILALVIIQLIVFFAYRGFAFFRR